MTMTNLIQVASVQRGFLMRLWGVPGSQRQETLPLGKAWDQGLGSQLEAPPPPVCLCISFFFLVSLAQGQSMAAPGSHG